MSINEMLEHHARYTQDLTCAALVFAFQQNLEELQNLIQNGESDSKKIMQLLMQKHNEWDDLRESYLQDAEDTEQKINKELSLCY